MPWAQALPSCVGHARWGAFTGVAQEGSQGQDVASALAVDPTTGDVVVCGSTSGELFPVQVGGGGDPMAGGSSGEEASPSGGKTQSFCAKLAGADGRVRVGCERGC